MSDCAPSAAWLRVRRAGRGTARWAPGLGGAPARAGAGAGAGSAGGAGAWWCRPGEGDNAGPKSEFL